MSERYVEVTGTVVRLNPRSLILEVDGEEKVIGRSCIWGPDEVELEKSDVVGDEVTIKVFEWLARKEGLT